MESFNFVNNYGKDIYIYPRTKDDKFILIKNNYKAGTYLISEIINDGVKIVNFDELNIGNKEVFEKKMQEYYLIHIANETGEITDGYYNLYEFQVEDIWNDVRVTYDNEHHNILKRVEIKKEDNLFEDFYLYLDKEELKEAKNIIWVFFWWGVCRCSFSISVWKWV